MPRIPASLFVLSKSRSIVIGFALILAALALQGHLVFAVSQEISHDDGTSEFGFRAGASVMGAVVFDSPDSAVITALRFYVWGEAENVKACVLNASQQAICTVDFRYPGGAGWYEVPLPMSIPISGQFYVGWMWSSEHTCPPCSWLGVDTNGIPQYRSYLGTAENLNLVRDVPYDQDVRQENYMIRAVLETGNAPGLFSGSGFDATCAADGRVRCTLTYDNHLGDRAQILFVFRNKSSGEVVDHDIVEVAQGSGLAAVFLDCPSTSAGTYRISWLAYKKCDVAAYTELNCSQWSCSEVLLDRGRRHIVLMYDANRDGRISADEANSAVNDYVIHGLLTKDEVCAATVFWELDCSPAARSSTAEEQDVICPCEGPTDHTVSRPNTPNGPSSGECEKLLTFSTGGASCNQGHSVQVRFDFGDGTTSSWSSSTSASHSYSAEGTFYVKAQARCASNHSIVSGWSEVRAVQIMCEEDPGSFEGSPFSAACIGGNRVRCTLRYRNDLGEMAQVLFLFKRCVTGEVIDHGLVDVGLGSGIAEQVFDCPPDDGGEYCISWIAYRKSDTSLATPVAWSKSTEEQRVVCPCGEQPQAGELVGVGGGKLMAIDTVTGAATVIGPTGYNLTDIAHMPDGRLLGVTSRSLVQVDPNTGSSTLVGSVGVSSVNSLTSSCDGLLYAATTNGRLLLIDPVTGRGTVIGLMGFPAGGDLAFAPDGTLYGISSTTLYRIDPNTAESALVGSTGFSRVYGLDFSPGGKLFAGSDVGPELMVLDPATGRGERIGEIANATRLSGLSFRDRCGGDGPTPEESPDPPSNLQATATSDNQIDLMWDDNSNNEARFELERRSEGGTCARIATTGSNMHTYSDSGLESGTEYCYRVRACNSSGCSDYSNKACSTLSSEEEPAQQRVSLTNARLSPPSPEVGSYATLIITLSTVGDTAVDAGSYRLFIDFYDVKSKRFDCLPVACGQEKEMILQRASQVREIDVPAISASQSVEVEVPSILFSDGVPPNPLISPALFFADKVALTLSSANSEHVVLVDNKEEIDVEVMLSPASVLDCIVAVALAKTSAAWKSIGYLVGEAHAFAALVKAGESLARAYAAAKQGDYDSVIYNTASIGLGLGTVMAKQGLMTVPAAGMAYLITLIEGAVGCGSLVTFAIGYVEVLLRDVDLNAFHVLSPADIVVTNTRGERTGYTQGRVYSEIAGSTVLVEGGEKLVIVPGLDSYSVVMTGTAQGEVTLKHIGRSSATSIGTICEFKSIQVNEQTVLSLEVGANGHRSALRVDQDGDGAVDEVVEPREGAIMTPGSSEKHLRLSSGRNFISFGLESVSLVPYVLCDENDICVDVRNWDSTGKAWKTAADGTLTCLDALFGYYMTVRRSTTIVVEGMPTVSDQEVTLETAGWQQIGVPYEIAWGVGAGGTLIVSHDGVEKSLADAVGAGWIHGTASAWNAEEQQWIEITGETGGTLDPWSGYWIYTFVDDVTLVFSDEPSLGETFSSSTHGRSMAVLPSFREETEVDADSQPSATNDSIAVISAPNPVRDVHTTTFMVKGICPCLVSGLMVSVYRLDGRLVWEGRTTGPELEWNTTSVDGERMSNGMYIYLSQVNVDGTWIPVEAWKLTVLH